MASGRNTSGIIVQRQLNFSRNIRELEDRHLLSLLVIARFLGAGRAVVNQWRTVDVRQWNSSGVPTPEERVQDKLERLVEVLAVAQAEIAADDIPQWLQNKIPALGLTPTEALDSQEGLTKLIQFYEDAEEGPSYG